MSQPTIGELLRHAREGLRASLAQASRETKIRPDYLEAMERDSFSFVSGRVYVRGMVRSYARWLGLDEDEVAAEFERVVGGPPPPPLVEALQRPAVVATRRRRPHWPAAAALASMILLALSLVGLLRPSENVARPPAPPQSPAPTSAAAPTPTPAQVAEAVPPPAPEGVRLVVNVVGAKCWVRVVADGKEAFQGTLFNGDGKTFEAKDHLRVTFGLLTAVRIQLNGKDVPIPPEFGTTHTFEFRPDSTTLAPLGG